MEVTSQNFDTAVSTIESLLPTCAFISIDCEMTGLYTSGKYNGTEVDNLQERYEKLKHSAQNFELIQFGLCLWHKECEFVQDEDDASAKQEKMFARPFNFYTMRERGRTKCFVSQADSLRFLVEHNFDFNKAFKYGIPYMNKTETASRKEELARFAKQKQQNTTSKIDLQTVNDYAKKVLNQTIEQVKEWFENSSSDSLKLPPSNSFIRRLVYQEIPALYPSKLLLKTEYDEKKAGYIVVSKLQEGQDELSRFLEEVELQVQKEVGFSKVVRLLEKYKPLLVGHNMGLDLVHFFDKFVDTLPPTLEEFKQVVLATFSNVLDTKFLSETFLQFKQLFGSNTSLSDLYTSISKNEQFMFPATAIHTDYDTYKENAKLHDAAYDAYITGIIFLKLSHYIGVMRDKIYSWNPFEMNHLTSYKNTVFMAKSDAHLQLDCASPVQPRDNILLVQNLKKNSTNDDLYTVFSKFGKIRTIWIDESSVYISFQDGKACATAWNNLQGTELGFTISMLQQPQQQASKKRSREDAELENDEEPAAKKSKSDSTCTVM